MGFFYFFGFVWGCCQVIILLFVENNGIVGFFHLVKFIIFHEFFRLIIYFVFFQNLIFQLFRLFLLYIL